MQCGTRPRSGVWVQSAIFSDFENTIMNEKAWAEGQGDGTSQPGWVAEQISLFTAAVGVKVRFAPLLGDAKLVDCLAEFCSVLQSEDHQNRTACQAWYEDEVRMIQQSSRAIRLRCPMKLDYLWAPVSKGGELYGFLHSEPVMQDGRPDGHERDGKEAGLSGEGEREAPDGKRRGRTSLPGIHRVKAAQSDGLLLLLELMGQRLGARFHQEKRLPVALSSAEGLVRRAEAVLSCRYHEDVSTCDVAGELQVSESHLCHAFQRVTGGTLRQYLNELRFTEACRLLKEHPQLTVGEVAFAAGFQSLSRFSEQFRRRDLPSPGKWRQSGGEGES
jgi:AraC-like DNA-binding protein